MPERYTDEARKVIDQAQEEARAHRRSAIWPTHILLGLLDSPGTMAAEILAASGITHDSVTVCLLAEIPAGEKEVTGSIPFTRLSKKCLELALCESAHLGDGCIDTQHILLGLCRDKNNEARMILKELGFDVCIESVRTVVLDKVDGYPTS